MKKLLAFAVVACVATSAFVSCGGGSASLKTDEDSISYALGVNLGMQIKDDPNISINSLLAGISDTYNGKEKIQQSDAGNIINEFFQVKLPAKNLKASEEFLANVEKNNNVQKTESGILYEILVAGDQSAKPTSDEDVVKVLYEGQLKNGEVFESSKATGDTVEFALNGVIRGWTEGLKYIGKGGKIKLWLPSDLAYGQQGNQMYGGPIGPNEALVFEIDLIDVMPAAADEE